jgi:penicillin-insensitive murein endopeptidase
MCRQFPQASWLYRLRPWWGHEDHFHVRLACPADSPLCRPQDALDPGDNGCGADLEWWFSAEADREWIKLRTSKEPRRFPALPEACTAMPGSE